MSMLTKQNRIAEIARKYRDNPLVTLHHHMDMEWMVKAFTTIKPATSPGVDGQTLAMYKEHLDHHLEDLRERAISGKYIAPPVKRVYIAKNDGKEQRPIGVPTVEDRILQRAVLQLLEPVYETDFYDFSFGFRPKKSQHHAIDYLWRSIRTMNINWIIDLDIRKFFDTMDHKHLRTFLKQRVQDGVVLRLIGKWLKAGVLEGGSISYHNEGSPQGGVISPLLSNIYLHEVLDKWFAQEIIPRMKGKAIIARFADDSVLGFEYKEDAERVFKVLAKRFSKYGLTLHPEKTKLVNFTKPDEETGRKGTKPGTFNFLGFTFYWGKSRKGKWIVIRKTAKDRLKRSLSKVNQWCRQNRHLSLAVQKMMLNTKLRGHFQYYGVTGNSQSLQSFRYQVVRLWKKWLSRRSNQRLAWDRLNESILPNFVLLRPKIYHSVYAAKP